MHIVNIFPSNMINPDMPRQKYELYLAHQILKNPAKFEFLAEGNGLSYKILDNSAYELGKGLELDLLLKAAEIINADEIVLPDLFKSEESFNYSLSNLIKIPKNFKRNIAIVAQGSSLHSLKNNLLKAKQIKRINTIMLPKWSWAYRSELMHLLIDTDKQIHWLGMGCNITEIICEYSNLIRSVDTGYFTALASTDCEQSIFNDRLKKVVIDLDHMDVDMNKLKHLMIQQLLLLEEINV